MRTRQQKKKDSAEKERQKILDEEKGELRRAIMDRMNERRDADRSMAKLDVVGEFERLMELAISERNRFEVLRTSGGELSDFQVNPEVEMFLPRIRREVDESIQRRAPPKTARKGRKDARSAKPKATETNVPKELNGAAESGRGGEEIDVEHDEVDPSQLNRTISEIMENVGKGFDLKALLLSLLPLIDRRPGPHQEHVQPTETPILRRYGLRQDQSPEAEFLRRRSSRNSLAQKGNQPSTSRGDDNDVMEVEQVDGGAKKTNSDVLIIEKEVNEPDRRRTSRRDSLIESLRKSVQRDPDLRRELESMLNSSTPEMASSRKRVSTPDIVCLGDDSVVNKKPRRYDVDLGSRVFGIVNIELRNAPSVDEVDLRIALSTMGLQNVREEDVVPIGSLILPCRGEIRRCANFRTNSSALTSQLMNMIQDPEKAEKWEYHNRERYGPNTCSYLFLTTAIAPIDAAVAVFMRSLSFLLRRTNQYERVLFDPCDRVKIIEGPGIRRTMGIRDFTVPRFRNVCNDAIMGLTPAGRTLIMKHLTETVDVAFWDPL